jgi:hypothetical protein
MLAGRTLYLADAKDSKKREIAGSVEWDGQVSSAERLPSSQQGGVVAMNYRALPSFS